MNNWFPHIKYTPDFRRALRLGSQIDVHVDAIFPSSLPVSRSSQLSVPILIFEGGAFTPCGGARFQFYAFWVHYVGVGVLCFWLRAIPHFEDLILNHLLLGIFFPRKLAPYHDLNMPSWLAQLPLSSLSTKGVITFLWLKEAILFRTRGWPMTQTSHLGILAETNFHWEGE